MAKKILIVEDEKPLADTLEERLIEEGFQVLKAFNGKEGLNLIIQDKPDVILLDLLMPVMDGKSMLSELRKMPGYKNTPVIILTNAGDIENIRDTQDFLDASDFLIKSNVSIDDIIAKIKTHSLETTI